MAVLLKQLENETNSQKETLHLPFSRLLCLEFLILLNRSCLSSSGPYVTTSSLDYRVSGLMAHINNHLEEDLSIPALASVCSLSPYHMMRVLRRKPALRLGAISQKETGPSKRTSGSGRKCHHRLLSVRISKLFYLSAGLQAAVWAASEGFSVG